MVMNLKPLSKFAKKVLSNKTTYKAKPRNQSYAPKNMSTKIKWKRKPNYKIPKTPKVSGKGWK